MLMRLPEATVGARHRLRRQNNKMSPLRVAGLVSLAIHAVVLAGLMVGYRYTPDSSADVPETPGAVELVMQEQKGVGPTTAPPEPAPVAAAPAPQQPELPVPPPPDPVTAADEALPLPPPPVPPPGAPPDIPPPTTPPVQRAQEAPEINLGGSDSETNAIVLDSPNVIPASVDAKFRNREPVYPMEAARRAEQGAVILVIHVSPEGLTRGVDVAQSSGFTMLDSAARDAVWSWHFLPAVRDGRPIPFDMKLRVVFHLD